MKHKFFSFILILIVWIIFAGSFTTEVLLGGIGISILTTYFFSDMLFRFSRKKISWYRYLQKGLMIVFFIPVFFYEAFVSALKVAGHVFERNPTFSPGIVKVKTKLTNVSALTLMANLITLTPGTLTLDFDKGERAYYIHWIDVTTREEAEKRKEIIERFENWLGVIFE